ncbi:MAG: hypothetical protein AAGF36_09940 [Pseudomonadota bacterium]
MTKRLLIPTLLALGATGFAQAQDQVHPILGDGGTFTGRGHIYAVAPKVRGESGPVLSQGVVGTWTCEGHYTGQSDAVADALWVVSDLQVATAKPHAVIDEDNHLEWDSGGPVGPVTDRRFGS